MVQVKPQTMKTQVQAARVGLKTKPVETTSRDFTTKNASSKLGSPVLQMTTQPLKPKPVAEQDPT
jgi:hypothetical protein